MRRPPGVQHAHEREYELAIVDLMVPGMSGLALCAACDAKSPSCRS